MPQFEGNRSFTSPAEFVAGKLTDAAFLVGCLKVDEVKESRADRAVWKQRTGFSFLPTSLEVTLEVVERTATGGRFKAVSRGVGATATVEAVIEVRPAEQGSLVHYSANIVERTGFLKLVSPGLIQSAAKSVIDDTWKAIDEQLKG